MKDPKKTPVDIHGPVEPHADLDPNKPMPWDKTSGGEVGASATARPAISTSRAAEGSTEPRTTLDLDALATMRLLCAECGGSGEGPDRVDGPGEVYRDKCMACDGSGEDAHTMPALLAELRESRAHSCSVGVSDLYRRIAELEAALRVTDSSIESISEAIEDDDTAQVGEALTYLQNAARAALAKGKP